MLSHAQEPSECHALILVKGVGKNFPRRQPCVHVSVERKALLIDQAQRADRSYEFRQRRRLKLAVGSQAIAVGTCECDLVLVDERDACGRNVERGHCLGERDLLLRHRR